MSTCLGVIQRSLWINTVVTSFSPPQVAKYQWVRSSAVGGWGDRISTVGLLAVGPSQFSPATIHAFHDLRRLCHDPCAVSWSDGPGQPKEPESKPPTLAVADREEHA